MTDGISQKRLLVVFASIVVAVLALQVALGFYTDGTRSAAEKFASGMGALLGLGWTIYAPTRRKAAYGAAIAGICAVLFILAALAPEFPPPGYPGVRYGLWTAAVSGLAQFSLLALIAAWARPSSRSQRTATRAASSSPGSEPPRRLVHRCRENRVILGVCGGIAEHLGADSYRLRWAVVLGAFVSVTSVAVLSYLLLAAFVPSSPEHATGQAQTERSAT